MRDKKFIIFIVIDLFVFFSLAAVYIIKANVIPVTASIEQKGEHFIVTARIQNNNNMPIKKTLNIYFKDGTGKKHFFDALDVKVGALQSKEVQSTKKMEAPGPQPYNVITEWERTKS